MTQTSSLAGLNLGVVGAGVMGQGIAQVALLGELNVQLIDVDQAAADRGKAAVRRRIERLAEKGSLAAADASAAMNRLRTDCRLEALSGSDAVIEAVFEDLTIKRQVFGELERVASIARGMKRPQRIAGMHFFNPVPLMKLVEVIKGPETDGQVIDFLMALGRAMGRAPVRVRDAPGFLVNFGGRAFTTEAIRLLHERVAEPADIDAVMRDCHGFQMGPCELTDLTGIDVNYPVCGFISEGYSNDPRLQTFFPHRALFEAGRFGRKTGQGHYAYADGRKVAPKGEPGRASKANGASPAPRVTLAEESEGCQRIGALLTSAGVEITHRQAPDTPTIVAPLGLDCSRAIVELGLDPKRTIAVDPLGDLSRRVCVMTARCG